MAEGKDIAYTQILYIGGAFVGGFIIGVLVCNSKAYKNYMAKREAKKNAKKTEGK